MEMKGNNLLEVARDHCTAIIAFITGHNLLASKAYFMFYTLQSLHRELGENIDFLVKSIILQHKQPD